jgi:uncharacterized protein (DUF885 family)
LKKLFVFALLALLLLGAAPAKKKPTAPGGGAAKELARIIAEYEGLLLEMNPALRMRKGLEVTRLPDYSFEADARASARLTALRGRLAKVDPKGLTHEQWISREVLDRQLGLDAELHDHFYLNFQLTPYTMPLRGLHPVFQEFAFKKTQDRDRYLDLLRQYARAVGQLRANLEAQRERGILLPKAEIDPVVGLIRSFIRKPEESVFEVSAERQKNFYPEGAEAFRAQVRKVVANEINPALEALAAVADAKAYRDAAPERVGLGQYPGGQKAYRYLVRVHTTMDDVTPEQIHERGLAEVARLNERLDALRKVVGFEGDLEAFRRFLKTNSRFFVKTPEEVGARLMAPIRRIEPRVKDFFGRVPKAPYGVARLEPELEGSMTYGYYRQPTPTMKEGDYLFNGSKLEERSLLSAASLIFHELIPGHHFQISLQIENESLPAFRQSSYPTAFVEGWGMYSSGLAEEMGGYPDPYDLAGFVAQDLFLSSRLVVDTGMNALGWSRQQAIDYMKANTLESDTQIGTETLRYSVDIPGQALAYKMGSNEIWELRRGAEQELGPKFDLKRFHDAIIGSGALPMTVLRKHVGWWVEREKSPHP